MNIVLDMLSYICRFKGRHLIRMHDKARHIMSTRLILRAELHFLGEYGAENGIEHWEWICGFVLGKSCRIHFILFAASGRFSSERTTGDSNGCDYRARASLKKKKKKEEKVHYKSCRPISFYRDVVIRELPRKPPTMFEWILYWICNNCKRFRIYIALRSRATIILNTACARFAKPLTVPNNIWSIYFWKCMLCFLFLIVQV